MRYRLEVDGLSHLSAFGLALQYPVPGLRFIGVRKTAATRDWAALAGKEVTPGRVLIAGFNHETQIPAGPTAVFEIVFQSSGQRPDDRSFLISDLQDDFSGATLAMTPGNQDMSSAPQHFKLYQNYPNPLHAGTGWNETVIRYDLPASTGEESLKRGSHVELIIYNLQGQVVRRLFSGTQPPGAHSISWDGRDDAGNKVPTGVYQYRLRAGTLVENRRLVLMK